MESITIKLVYNSTSEKLYSELKEFINNSSDIQLEAYHEEYKKDRKKAFSIKSSWSTRQTPFVILENEKPIKAFYSDNNECTLSNIISFINERSKNS